MRLATLAGTVCAIVTMWSVLLGTAETERVTGNRAHHTR